jgi:Fe-S cluster assembly iron-binding protein IscA
MIEIEDATKQVIKEILDNNPGKHLSIVVEGNGCAGPYLKLFLDEAESYEVPVRVNGLDILMSDDVKKYSEASSLNIFVNWTEENIKNQSLFKETGFLFHLDTKFRV